MSNLYLKNKIEQLSEILDSSSYSYTYKDLIRQLINNNRLDNVINKINDVPTIPDVTSVIKKESLSGDEQFLIMLNSFISRFKKDFYFINEDTNYIISSLLFDTNYSDYILCKYYVGNNNYIPFFEKSYFKLVIHGFYHNLQKLALHSELINKFATDNKININKNLEEQEQIRYKLFLLLQKLTLSNIKESNIFILFESIDDYCVHITSKENFDSKNIESLKESTLYFYLFQWEKMIETYYKKIDAINTIFD